MNYLFIEAESFENSGGWVVDQQSIEQMGSAYLMAHGYGVPVKDATTNIDISADGEYTVWARTRDWTAVWERGSSAGIFNIKIDDEFVSDTLGNNGKEWTWQRAGKTRLKKGRHTISLHDLTGFNGRCDAVFMTDDESFIPPDDSEKLKLFREEATGNRVTDNDENFDLIVVGGGIAGVCASISAMNAGCKVLLLQDRDVLGGCNSSEIRVGVGGRIFDGPYPKIGNIVKNITPAFSYNRAMSAEWYEDHRKLAAFRNCDVRNLRHRVLLGEHVTAIEKAEDNTITAVISVNIHTGKKTRFSAPLFVDATGDATLARMAGASLMYGRESRDTFNESLAPEAADNQVMGHSVLWYSKPQSEASDFPDIDWAIPFNDDNCYYIRGGDWEQETGQYRDMVNDIEYIRDYGLLTIYSNWAFLKNHSSKKDEFKYDKIDWVSPIGGKRESYRVVGDHILTQNDIENKVDYPDKSAVMNWSIDLHFPEPDNSDIFGEAFRSCAYHRGIEKSYPVPYRCLYSRDVNNLFLAGRDISTSHIAFSSIRVMRTLGGLAEVVGMAAGICKAHGVNPREIYEKYLDELKEKLGKGGSFPESFVCGPDFSEAYHFKDIGWFRLNPYTFDGKGNPEIEDKFVRNIRRLNMSHKYKEPEILNKK